MAYEVMAYIVMAYIVVAEAQGMAMLTEAERVPRMGPSLALVSGGSSAGSTYIGHKYIGP